MIKQIYLNISVKDLKKTIKFFTSLGFKFNAKFTNESGTCMKVGNNIYVMLLVEKFFKTFINKNICDAKKSTEAIIGLAVNSKKEVDEIMKKAIAAGGNELRQAQDHGWMYTRSFEDLDGHIWEVFYMNESKMPKEMKDKK